MKKENFVNEAEEPKTRSNEEGNTTLPDDDGKGDGSNNNGGTDSGSDSGSDSEGRPNGGTGTLGPGPGNTGNTGGNGKG